MDSKKNSVPHNNYARLTSRLSVTMHSGIGIITATTNLASLFTHYSVLNSND